MIVGFLGPEGTYTEEAAHEAHPGAVYVPYPTIDAVFAALAAGVIGRGVVPIENVIHGPVTETLDNLYQFADRLKIIDMQVRVIEHAIGTLADAGAIRRIMSKDQAIKQCSEYLRLHYPQAQPEEAASTSAAMRRIVQENLRDAAAIGSPAALQTYGLVVRERHIGNSKNNKTRFAILGAITDADALPTGVDVTALAIYPRRDRIGLLQGILSVVSEQHGLSCLSIHSRPDAQGAFRFYLEVDGHAQNSVVAACLQSLKRDMQLADSEVKVFGTYPWRAFNPPRLRKVGIVGGTGQMGGWFQPFFTRAGYQVAVSGLNSALSHEACVRGADAVLVNVPIHATPAVLEQIGGWLRPGQLWVDNTSIKTIPVATMLRVAPPGVEVIGMHTVFGPSIASLRDQNIIFTPTASSGVLADEFESIFHKHGARITRTTPENHDKQMALHQNIEHFSKIVLAELIHTHFADPQELLLYGSPNSRASLATMGRMLSHDPALYAEIQKYNLQGPTLIQAFVDVAQKLNDAIQAADVNAVQRSLTESITALGPDFLGQMFRDSQR